MKQIHDGHRGRLRRKFLSGSQLEKHELLELLLFYSIPRRNTNEIAHRLLARFGSLRRILDADISALTEVEGVGLQTALFLRTLAAVNAAAYSERAEKVRRLSTEADLRHYLVSLLLSSSREEVYLLLFGSSGHLIHTEKLGEGLASFSQLSIRRAVQLSCCHHATSAVLAHNHPDGMLLPSDHDMKATKRIRQALSEAGVDLINHYIVSGTDCLPVTDEYEKQIF
ncbi:MAG: hypothetical protein IJY47_07965 [Clostridia bacterium]|nr:hypothetical protein [Clostridia bacterium]